MNVYFSSDYPCAIKIDGIFFSKLNKDLIACKINDCSFIEVCSLIDTQTNKNFFLDEDFFASPPDFVSITDLKGGYLIKFNKKHGADEFKIIHQHRHNNCLVTVFSDKGYKLSVESNCDFFAEDLNFDFDSATSIEHIISSENLLCILFKCDKDNILSVYHLGNKTTKVFERRIEDYSVSRHLITTENNSDILKHTVTCEWQFQGDKFSLISKKSIGKKEINLQNLKIEIIPYLFLEVFLAGGDFFKFVDENVKECADKLGDYLGNYIGVIPPPLFRESNQVGLIYKLKNNLYEVKYFTFEIKNRKIVNIISVE